MSSTAPTPVTLSDAELAPLAAARPIALIGLRGVGKTAVGRRLSELTGRRFLDLDQRTLRTARHAGHAADDIAALLEGVGASRFRDLEASALRQVLEPGIRCVLATGGGAVERADSRSWLRRAGLCVWLTASTETLEARIRSDGASRPPLLGGDDAVEELPELLRRREPLYAAVAHARVACDDRGVDEIAKEITTRFGIAGEISR